MGLHQMIKDISANKKGSLPISIVPFPAFDVCLPWSRTLANSVCYADARNSLFFYEISELNWLTRDGLVLEPG